MSCRINCCPYSALDVVFSTSRERAEDSPLTRTNRSYDLTNAAANAVVEDSVVAALDVASETAVDNFGPSDISSSPLAKVDALSKARLFQQVVKSASREAQDSKIEQRFISLLTPEIMENKHC